MTSPGYNPTKVSPGDRPYVKTLIMATEDQLEYGKEYCKAVYGAWLPGEYDDLVNWLEEMKRL